MFLVVIVIYLSIAFEWQMAIAAFVALIHDIVITIGRVRAGRVPGEPGHGDRAAHDPRLLAVRHGGGLRQGPGEYRRPARDRPEHLQPGGEPGPEPDPGPVDQHLADRAAAGHRDPRGRRSRCSGTGELQDLALVLFVGMLSGTYSSIFIATPVLAGLKEREPQYKQLASRVALRASGGRAAQRARAKAEKAGRAAGAGGGAGADPAPPGWARRRGPVTDAELARELATPTPSTTRSRTTPMTSADAGTDERVPAGRTASAARRRDAPAPGARTGPRQQPRRSSAAKRRPAGKKKRR